MHGNKTFQWLGCFEVVKELPKWREMQEDKDKSNGKRGRSTKNGKENNNSHAQKKPRGNQLRKRRKALDDQVKCLHEEYSDTTGMEKQGTDSFDKLASSLASMADGMEIHQWEESDRKSFLKNKALIKTLEQQKEILKLQAEVNELSAPAVAVRSVANQPQQATNVPAAAAMPQGAPKNDEDYSTDEGE